MNITCEVAITLNAFQIADIYRDKDLPESCRYATSSDRSSIIVLGDKFLKKHNPERGGYYVWNYAVTPMFETYVPEHEFNAHYREIQEVSQ